jgi:hypothetical protein
MPQRFSDGELPVLGIMMRGINGDNEKAHNLQQASLQLIIPE